MTRKLIAVMALSFALSACESSTPESAPNTNANTPAASPTSATTPAPVATPAATSELKAGDKVKVNTNGATSEATVVSVDEKAGKVTVRVQGEKQEKTVALADIVKK